MNMKEKIKEIQMKPNVQRALLVMTILYLFSPIDIIPDAVPLAGMADDLMIVIAEIVQALTYMKNKRKQLDEAINAGQVDINVASNTNNN